MYATHACHPEPTAIPVKMKKKKKIRMREISGF
jgi:hypothetical protein